MGLRRPFIHLLLVVSIRSSFIDLPTILDASGIPDCAHTCISDLIHTARQFLSGKKPVDTFRDLCLSYHNASQCIARRQFEGCFDVTAYDIGLSGLQTLCLGQEKKLRRHETCLDENFNSVFHQCDQLCMFTKSLSDLSHQKNIRKLAKYGGGYKKFLREIPYVCSSVGCLSSCIAHQLNGHCPPSGTIIIESLLNPFLRIIHLLNELGLSARNAVHRQIPPQCYYLINEDKIRNITIGIAPNEEEQLKWGHIWINESGSNLLNNSHILQPHKLHSSNNGKGSQYEVQNLISLDQILENSNYSPDSEAPTTAVYPSGYNSHGESLVVHELPIDQTFVKPNPVILSGIVVSSPAVANIGYDTHDSGESVEVQDNDIDALTKKDILNGELTIPELIEPMDIIDKSNHPHHPIVHYNHELQGDHESVIDHHSAGLPDIHSIYKEPKKGHTVFESYDWLSQEMSGEHKVNRQKCMDLCRSWFNHREEPFGDYYRDLEERKYKDFDQPFTSAQRTNAESSLKSIPHL